MQNISTRKLNLVKFINFLINKFKMIKKLWFLLILTIGILSFSFAVSAVCLVDGAISNGWDCGTLRLDVRATLSNVCPIDECQYGFVKEKVGAKYYGFQCHPVLDDCTNPDDPDIICPDLVNVVAPDEAMGCGHRHGLYGAYFIGPAYRLFCKDDDDCGGYLGCCDTAAEIGGCSAPIEWYADEDGDGWRLGSQLACIADGIYIYENTGKGVGDCDDNPATGGNVHRDEWWYQDEDGDGWHAASSFACNQPAGNGWSKSPGNGGNDCDDNPATGTPYHVVETWYQDYDGDGLYGASGDECGPPAGLGWVRTQLPKDCDDTDGAIVHGSINPTNECEKCGTDGNWGFHNGNGNEQDGDCKYCDSTTGVLEIDADIYPSGDGDCKSCDTAGAIIADPGGVGDSASIDCKKCSSTTWSLDDIDDSENVAGDGDCKKCDGGSLVNDVVDNVANDGDCKQCSGGLLIDDDGDTGITIPCKKCDGGSLVTHDTAGGCGANQACCAGVCYSTNTYLCCDKSLSSKSAAYTCGSCNKDCTQNQGSDCNTHYPVNCKVTGGLFSSSYACRECTGGTLAIFECGEGHNCVFGQCVDSIPSTIGACLIHGPRYVGLSSPITDPDVLRDVCEGQLPTGTSCEQWVVTGASLVVPVLPSLGYRVACYVKDALCGTPLPPECACPAP